MFMVHFGRGSGLVVLPNLPENSAGTGRSRNQFFQKNECLPPHFNSFPIEPSQKQVDDIFGFVVRVLMLP